MPAPTERSQSPASSLAQTPNPSRSLFPSAPAFTIETFSRQDFNVKDFVESLSESAAPANRRSGGAQGGQAFDPKPLIRSFEHALHRLSELAADLEARETELSAAVRKAEAQHTTHVDSLGRKLDRAIGSFRKLDRSLNEGASASVGSNGAAPEDDAGGSAAVKIGERLEELDRQRTRAQDSRFLVQCWFEVSERGELYLLEDMRLQAAGEKKIRCAQIARQLLKISQRLDPGHWPALLHENGGGTVDGANDHGPAATESNGNARVRHNTREIIEKFRESLEKDLLKQFDEFYRKADFDGMKECSTVLQDFNGGASVIAAFVNQHQFFIDRSQLITEELGDSEIWEQLADPDADPPGVEPSLQALVDDVKIVVKDESTLIIPRAFSYYDVVLARFLQRVFQQSIQQRLEMVLQKTSGISTLAFLRSLQSSRSYINAMVNDLKAHGLTEHPEALSAQTALVLDQQFDDLFVPYFVGTSYIEREKRNLEELYSSLLFKFTVYHSQRRKAPTTFLASLAKSGSELLSSARDAYLERLDSSDLAPQQKAMLFRVAGLRDTDSARKQAEAELSEADGLVDAGTAKRMLRWLAEGVGRSLELSSGGSAETPRDVAALLDLLLAHMGQLYVEVALDAALDAAAAQESARQEPDLGYLEHLNAAITAMHLMTMCINTVLIPLAAGSAVVRREMDKTTNVALIGLEDKINVLMQRTIDVCVAWVAKLLAGQKKSDFRPREDSNGQTPIWQLLQTPTCLAIYTFLSRVHNLALIALSPSANLTAFLTELAVHVRGLLLEHFAKFQVSASGGLMVTKDMSKYCELLRGWDLDPAFEPSLEILPLIGNIFVIGPEALRERLKGKSGGSGGMWEKSDLRPYVLRRDDVSSVGIQSVLSSF